MPKKNKAAKKPEQVQQGSSNSHHQHHHHHPGEECGDHSDGHSHGPQAAFDRQGMEGLLKNFQQLTQQLGIPTLKPDDPLPDLSDFDRSKKLIEDMTLDFQHTVKLIQDGKYDQLDKIPEVPQEKVKQQKKQTNKQQQIQKENALKELRQHQDQLDKTQKKLKNYLDNPKLAEIKNEIKSVINSLSGDIKECVARQKLIESNY